MKKIYILLIVIFIIFFGFFYYKNQKLGNNIIKLSDKKNFENILSENFSYKSEAKVKVYSNKNKNEYKLKIEEEGKNYKFELLKKGKNQSFEIEKKNGDLTIKNSKLNLNKIYNNYNETTDNSLLLSDFVKDYKEAKSIKTDEKNNQTIIKIELKNSNKYIKYKEIYLNSKTGTPEKLAILDSSNNPRIIIEYTSIDLKYNQ